MDPGADLNTPDDDLSIRMPDQQDLKAQIKLKLLPFIKHDVSVNLQVLNVLALRYPLTIGVRDGNDYNTMLTRQIPFTIRLGVDYKW
jgi:hypothetical protein